MKKEFFLAMILLIASQAGARPVLRAGRPAVPLLAVVLDDFGRSKKNFEILKEANLPVTIAVLPGLPYSGELCSSALENGMDAILHIPMEPLRKNVDLEKGTIMAGMDNAAVKKLMESSLDSVGPVNGASNHMGSKATAARRVMKVVMDVLKDRKLFFLNSRTIESRVPRLAARGSGVLFFERDVFIDEAADERAIGSQLRKAAEIAKKKGYAIAVGHDRELTVKTLLSIAPELEKSGVKFVRLTDLIEKASAC